VRRVAAGSLLFPACLAAASVVFVVYSISTGDSTWDTTVPLVFVAAVVLNACTWLEAILFGRTRQLRSGWFMVVAILVAMGAAATIWPKWGRDVDIVMAAAVIALGFPASWILFVVFRHPLPWGLQRVSGVIGPLSVLGISYLQAFVLLPLVFRRRAAKARPPEG
jgi:phosphatidylserine synthase